MDSNLKATRKYLKESTRKEFETAIYESNLTKNQEDALRLHIVHDKTIVAISLELNCSERTVNNALHEAYFKIHKYLCITYSFNTHFQNSVT